MRAIIPDPIDRVFRHESLKIDRICAFKRHGLEIGVFERHIVVGADRIALDLIIAFDRLMGLRIDIAALDAMARLFVQRMKADFLAFRHSRRHGDRACHQREFEIPLPECDGCHDFRPSLQTDNACREASFLSKYFKKSPLPPSEITRVQHTKWKCVDGVGLGACFARFCAMRGQRIYLRNIFV